MSGQDSNSHNHRPSKNNPAPPNVFTGYFYLSIGVLDAKIYMYFIAARGRERQNSLITMPNITTKRRAFGSLLLGSCAVALAANDKRDALEPFHWARIKFLTTGTARTVWDVAPQADVYMLKELKRRTGLNIDTTWYVAPLDDLDEMCKYPFLFITTEGSFEFTSKQQVNLVEYLKRGGFIFADDCVYSEGQQDGFFVDFKNKIEHLFGRPMVKLPNDHEIYHSFYDFPNGLPHVQGIQHGGYALFIDGRMAIFLSPSDIHCGWYGLDRVSRGHSIAKWVGVHRCKEALKMGINIMMYVMSH
jgi:hypothetical protein